MALIAPSILAADPASLGEAVDKLKGWGADWVHLDVMDGQFVPAITFGEGMIKALRKHSSLTFDAHLMVDDPARYIIPFKQAGADIFTFHAEADRHICRTIDQIHQVNMKAGVALNPATPLCAVENVLEQADMILLMSVNPGAGGQKFIPMVLDKIHALSEMILSRGLRTLIEVDGGVTPLNARACVEAGADVLVAGSSVFKADDPIDAIEKMKA